MFSGLTNAVQLATEFEYVRNRTAFLFVQFDENVRYAIYSTFFRLVKIILASIMNIITHKGTPAILDILAPLCVFPTNFDDLEMDFYMENK